MKNILSMNFRLARPKVFPGRGDKYLPKIIQNLANLLRKTQKDYQYDTLRLPADKIRDLSQILVEFAEDVHNDIGIWDSLEKYNLEIFGSKLPLIPSSTKETARLAPINKYRLQYLLWNQYQLIYPDLIISPRHRDLAWLSEVVADFLLDRFKNLPLGSGIQNLFDEPDEFGWDVKRKLIWLGKHSYLFRKCYQDYIQLHGGKPDTAVIDDFICQETTSWAGLGAIDIMASILKITESQSKDLRSWYERHTAFYKVLSINDPFVRVLNIVNDKPYTVRVGEFSSQFDMNHLYFGGLVPWKGEWYWSGEQKRYDNISDEDLPKFKNTLFGTPQTIVYRYCKDLAEKARESVKEQYRFFVDYHGTDMVVYPDGRSMAADMRNQYILHNESKLKPAGKNPSEHQTPEVPDFTKSFPPDLIKSNNGVGVYFNPDEGQEIMRDFMDIVSGFKKKGINIIDDELDAVRGFVESDAISPSFVNKLIQEYGDESIRVAYLIPDEENDCYLDFLFRRHKGHFYRERYPSISFSEAHFL